MYDLAIIGGGFWGIATALDARAFGWDVAVFDDNREAGASRCATGIVARDWYVQHTVKKMLPLHWTKKDIDYSIAWLILHAGARDVGELFSTFANPNGYRLREGCYIVDSAESLLMRTPVDFHRRVHYIIREDDGNWSVWSDGPTVTARHVLVAAGAFTNELLEASELPTVPIYGLRGRAIIFDAPHFDLPGETPITRMPLPYRHITIRRWGDRMEYYRIGDTTERGANNKGFEFLRNYLGKWVGNWEQVGIVDGIRPVPTERMIIRPLMTDAPNLIVATGGHRVGLGLAGVVSREVLQQFGMWEDKE